MDIESQDMFDWQILYVSYSKKFKNTIVSSHRKSNHVFTVWQQHLILLTIRQYESKSYRMFFVEWLIEAHYLRLFLRLSRIPHFTTLQEFTDRINNAH